MKGLVELVGIGNYVRLEDGAQENRLFIRLPTGKQIESVISDEHLNDVVEAFSKKDVPVQREPQGLEDVVRIVEKARAQAAETKAMSTPSTFEKEILANGEEAMVFGAPPSAPVEPSVQELAPVIPIDLPPRRSRLVGKDEAGNPIVEVDGAEDPSNVTGDVGDKDEDGVAQL